MCMIDLSLFITCDRDRPPPKTFTHGRPARIEFYENKSVAWAIASDYTGV